MDEGNTDEKNNGYVVFNKNIHGSVGKEQKLLNDVWSTRLSRRSMSWLLPHPLPHTTARKHGPVLYKLFNTLCIQRGRGGGEMLGLLKIRTWTLYMYKYTLRTYAQKCLLSAHPKKTTYKPNLYLYSETP